jgi:tetratricopeptide (TPR) repeat protein
MTLALDGRRVFIASPTGLESERTLVRETIAKFNRAFAVPQGVVFIDEGWEESPPGVGRAQSLINETLDPCDFLIVLLADKWGSPPGGNQYTSGTEEEFMRAVGHLADPTKNMRDIHVYFRSIPADRLADPGPELAKVLDFKTKLQESGQFMHGGTFDSREGLAAKIEGSLRKWSIDLDEKVPLTIDLESPPSTALGATGDLLEAAVSAASSGKTVQAEILFAKASQTGDLKALIEFARFSRRRGLYDDAIALNQQVVAALSPRASRTVEEAAYLVRALANIGVIHRKKGDLARSIRSLEEAIDAGSGAPQPIFDDVAYALDNLGHSLGQIGQYTEARDAFNRAIEERRAGGEDGIALSSQLNLGWLALRAGNFEDARETFKRAETGARTAGPGELANCLAGLGDALMKLQRPREAIPHLKEALAINHEISNSDGIGIASGLLARAFAAVDDLSSADDAIRETLRESEASGSVIGLATGYWGKALINTARDHTTQAQVDFEEALKLSRSTGNVALTKAIERSRLDAGNG